MERVESNVREFDSRTSNENSFSLDEHSGSAFEINKLSEGLSEISSKSKETSEMLKQTNDNMKNEFLKVDERISALEERLDGSADDPEASESIKKFEKELNEYKIHVKSFLKSLADRIKSIEQKLPTTDGEFSASSTCELNDIREEVNKMKKNLEDMTVGQSNSDLSAPIKEYLDNSIQLQMTALGERLTSNLEDLQTSNEKLSGEVGKLEDKSGDIMQKVEDLRSSSEQINEKISYLEGTSNELKSDVSTLKQYRVDVSGDFDNLRTGLCDREMGDIQCELDELKRRDGELESHTRDLESQMEYIKSDVNSVSRNVETISSSLENLRIEDGNIRAKFEKYKKLKLKSLYKYVKKVKPTIDQVVEKNVVNEVDDMKINIGNLFSDIYSIRSDIHKYEEDMKKNMERDGRLESIECELQNIKSSPSNHAEILTEFDDRLATLESKISSASTVSKSKVDEIAEEISRLANDINNLKIDGARDLTRLQDDLGALKKEFFSKSIVSSEAGERSNVDVRKKIQELGQTIYQHLSDVQKIGRAFDNFADKYDKKISQVSDSLEKSLTRSEELSKAATNGIDNIKSGLENCEAKIYNVEQSLLALQEKHGNSVPNIGTLETSVSDVGNSLQKMLEDSEERICDKIKESKTDMKKYVDEEISEEVGNVRGQCLDNKSSIQELRTLIMETQGSVNVCSGDIAFLHNLIVTCDMATTKRLKDEITESSDTLTSSLKENLDMLRDSVVESLEKVTSDQNEINKRFTNDILALKELFDGVTMNIAKSLDEKCQEYDRKFDDQESNGENLRKRINDLSHRLDRTKSYLEGSSSFTSDDIKALEENLQDVIRKHNDLEVQIKYLRGITDKKTVSGNLHSKNSKVYSVRNRETGVVLSKMSDRNEIISNLAAQAPENPRQDSPGFLRRMANSLTGRFSDGEAKGGLKKFAVNLCVFIGASIIAPTAAYVISSMD